VVVYRTRSGFHCPLHFLVLNFTQRFPGIDLPVDCYSNSHSLQAFWVLWNWPTMNCLKMSQISSGVTRVGDTRGGNWGSPLYFSWKTWRPFFIRQFCGVTPDFFFAKTDDLFLLITFYCFHSGVTASRVSPTPFFYLSDLVFPLFFVNLPTKFFFLRVSPLEVVNRGGPPPPSYATADQ